MTKAKVKVKDNGYKKMLQNIAKAAEGFAITVGLHSEDADGTIMLKGGALEDSHNWLSGYVDAHEATFIRTVNEDMAAALAAGKNPVQRADQLAQKFAADVQGNFANLLPRNSPETVKRKGFDAPGIETGQLRSTIRGKLEAK